MPSLLVHTSRHDAVPDYKTIEKATADQLPVLRETVQRALTTRTPPDVAQKFVAILAARTKRPASLENDPSTAAIFLDALIELTAEYPPAILEDVLRQATFEFIWTPTCAELRPLLGKCKQRLRQLVKAIDEEERARAAFKERTARRQAMIDETLQHARVNRFNIADAAMLDAFVAGEKFLTQQKFQDLRRGIQDSAPWAAVVVMMLCDVWTKRPDLRDKQLTESDADFIAARLNAGFQYIRDGRDLMPQRMEAEAEMADPPGRDGLAPTLAGALGLKVRRSSDNPVQKLYRLLEQA